MATRRPSRREHRTSKPSAPGRHDGPAAPQAIIVLHATQRLVGQALAATVAAVPGAGQVTLTSDPLETLERCTTLQPRLVILTTAPHDAQAVSLTRAINAHHPHPATAILAHDANVPLLHEAHHAGATLVLPLAADADQLTSRLATLLRPPHRVPLADWLQLSAQHAAPMLLPDTGTVPLAAQQQRLLHLMARGLTNAAIAAELGLSDKTVRNHISRMLAKLGARTRTEAVLIGLSTNLIALPAKRPPPRPRPADPIAARRSHRKPTTPPPEGAPRHHDETNPTPKQA